MNKQQLARRIWSSANKMRAKIEASEYKDYILGLIFYKFLSDHEEEHLLRGETDTKLTDEVRRLKIKEKIGDEKSFFYNQMRINCISNIGYFIAYEDLFSTWLLPDSNFGVSELNKALQSFELQIKEEYKSVYEGIFDTLRAGLDKLGENPTKQTRALKDIIRLIKDIPTDGQQDYDVLGYVYEFLISNFAANAGKKAGEFYTPHEVAQLMSEIVAEHHKNKQLLEIYDPTSGSGSLLITIGRSLARHIESKNKVKYYAQELKTNTYNLTRMNLVMRGIEPSNIVTRNADSLSEDWPLQKQLGVDKPLYVDAVVSNPPYSQHWDPTDAEHDPRFKDYGVAPKTKADYAFLLHELHHLKPDGILTIVLPHGVLFRGGDEERIRRNLIEKNQVDAIIGLPANIFFGTGIPTLIMVLKQRRTTDEVLFVDASKGYIKDGKQNRLRACDIRRIVDTVRDRRTVEGFARTVSRDEIRANDYNLNLPRYVDSSEEAERYDIYATLFGGIPHAEIDRLAPYWRAFPSLRSALFAAGEDRPYARLRTADVLSTIEQNADVRALRAQFAAAFEGFAASLDDQLIGHYATVNELQTQDAIAADLFTRMRSLPLVDPYAAYQALAEEWQQIAGDLETLQTEGWDAARQTETAYRVVKKQDEEVEVPDGLKGRILPFALVQQERFADELQRLERLAARIEAINGEVDEVKESFTEEETEAYCDAEKDNALLKPQVKQDAKKLDVEEATRTKLKTIVDLWNEQTRKAKLIKEGREALEQQTIEAMKELTDEEVAHFLHLKWVDPICSGIDATLTSVLTDLEQQVQALSEKYAQSYEHIVAEQQQTQHTLSTLVDELTGDDFAIEGLKALFQH